jgi:hypothetical protein
MFPPIFANGLDHRRRFAKLGWKPMPLLCAGATA